MSQSGDIAHPARHVSRPGRRAKGEKRHSPVFGKFKTNILVPDLNLQRFLHGFDQITQLPGAAGIGVSIGKKSQRDEVEKEYP